MNLYFKSVTQMKAQLPLTASDTSHFLPKLLKSGGKSKETESEERMGFDAAVISYLWNSQTVGN